MIGEEFDGVAIVIPAFNPGNEILDLVGSLKESGFKNIVVVNDGSESPELFEVLSEKFNPVICEHLANQGKGAALKLGFSEAIVNFGDTIKTILTVDADGQHLPNDVVRLAEAALSEPKDLIMGVRNFSPDVPLRSRLGNIVTRKVLKLVNGVDLKDTQTGLRAIPVKLVYSSLKIPSKRYQFELECILLAKKSGFRITQLPIATVYIQENESSHFRPVVDSMRIYFVFVRFLVSSLGSFFVDISAFALLYALTSNVYASTYAARLVSASMNFLSNKYLVFKSTDGEKMHYEAAGYIFLAICIATLSAFLVNLLGMRAEMNIVYVKVLVDIALFFFSFFGQRVILFKQAS